MSSVNAGGNFGDASVPANIRPAPELSSVFTRNKENERQTRDRQETDERHVR